MTESSSSSFWHWTVRCGATDENAALCLAEIDQGRLSVNARSAAGYTLLMEAAHAKDLRLIDGLLVRRADVTCEENQFSALYWACRPRAECDNDESCQGQVIQALSRLLSAWPGNQNWRSCARGPLTAALDSRWFTCALWLLGQGAHLHDAMLGRPPLHRIIDAECVKLAATFRAQVRDALLGCGPVCLPCVVWRMIAAYVV